MCTPLKCILFVDYRIDVITSEVLNICLECGNVTSSTGVGVLKCKLIFPFEMNQKCYKFVPASCILMKQNMHSIVVKKKKKKTKAQCLASKGRGLVSNIRDLELALGIGTTGRPGATLPIFGSGCLAPYQEVARTISEDHSVTPIFRSFRAMESGGT